MSLNSFLDAFKSTIEIPQTDNNSLFSFDSQSSQTNFVFVDQNNHNNFQFNSGFSPISQIEYLPGQMIMTGEIPNQPIWCLEPIYKVSQTGGTMMWQIGFDGVNRVVTIHGYVKTTKGVPGKITRDSFQISVSSHNSNIHEQALQECKQRTIEKKREGYNLLEAEGSSELSIQKGHPYYPPGAEVRDPKTGEMKRAPIRITDDEFPVILDAKVDGIRGRIRKVGDQIVILSTNKRFFKYKNHIRQMLKPIFDYLPPGVDIDGELYCPWMTWQDIVSVVKTENVCHPRDNEMGFYMFDIIIPNVPLQQRISMLRDAYFECVKQNLFDVRIQLLRKYIAYNHQDILAFHEWVVQNKWEGAIVRKLAAKDVNGNYTEKSLQKSIYKGGKNNNLLKVKSFIDEECLIKDIICGDGREENAAIFICQDIRGNTFNLRPCGSIEERIKMYFNKHLYIDKVYTFKYFSLTNDGLPKFPTGKGFRDYE